MSPNSPLYLNALCTPKNDACQAPSYAQTGHTGAMPLIVVVGWECKGMEENSLVSSFKKRIYF